MATTYSMRHEHGNIFLDGPSTSAVLRTGTLRLKRAEIEAGGGSLPIEITDRRRREARAGTEKKPVLQLSPKDSFVPGKGRVRWEVKMRFKGYRGVVSQGADRIEVFLPRFGRTPECTVVGHWDQVETVTLAACFVLMNRRRRDGAIAAAASSGGSGS
ncbi:hypothetical protein [Streptomyces sp. NPDC050560]|uniref:hypothetical protein n=1 Tax=Streptomyces sp. NPDC050560 TaxID=3365630 RepID=UPI0037A12D0E